MNDFLLPLLDCPKCRSAALKLISEERFNNDITSGELRCNCGSAYPIINGIPRFLQIRQPSQVQRRFEYQWKKWGKDKVIFGRKKEESIKFFLDFSGSKINPDYLKGKFTLDAGCGHGRFAEIMAEFGAFSVGLDLGAGVDIAREKTKNFHNASIVQGDIMNPPFKEAVFDYIWSNGVIHHTPNTRLAFSKLVEMVKPQGFLDIWVYPKKGILWELTQKSIRIFTTHMSAQLLTTFCYTVVPLLSVVPTFSKTRFPKNSWRECAQVIFDWYSPQYQSHHTNEEVLAWYKEEGFKNIEVLNLPVAISGEKS